MVKHESLAAALAAFQADLPSVHKNAVGQVPGKGKNKYADLAGVSAVVLPALAKQGLSFSAKPTLNDQGQFGLAYVLRHEAGDKDDGFFPMPMGTAWEVGSWISYARRYCLQAVTGVAADEDDDGEAAQRSNATPPQQRTNGQQQRPAAPAQETPAEPPPPPKTAGEARALLASTCAENNWDLGIVAGLFESHAHVALGAATDRDQIMRFRGSLFAVSDDELRKQPAANGAQR